MRTFVTGASGFIGLHLLRAFLDAGHNVTAVVRSPHKLGPFGDTPGLTIVGADLERDVDFPQLLQGHDLCVHAALIWGDPGTELELIDPSVSAKLFDAAARVGVRRSLYVSSAAVHRPFAGEMYETDALSPPDLYSATKAAGELFLRAACGSGAMCGIALRPGPVVGPPAFPGGAHRSPDRIAEMVRAARAGEPISVVQNAGRQLSDVRRVAQLATALCRIDAPRPAYMAVEREITTWEEIARTVVRVLNSQSEVRVTAAPADFAPPRFRTDHSDAVLGGPSSALAALVAHLRHVANERNPGDEGSLQP